MQNSIWITTQFEGYHKYPDAPQEVEFLKYPHRHIFKLKIWIEVFHNDRDIEFFMFKNFINRMIEVNNLNNKSCEMISDDIYTIIKRTYPERNVWIEVSEDGENGSFKKYIKEEV
jgi:hypothetical protein